MWRFRYATSAAILACLAAPTGATAQTSFEERLCDTQFEDCRAPLIKLIQNEQVGIDVAFWYMQDAWYVSELTKRFSAGVPVRVLVDQRANKSYPLNETMLTSLRNAGIPMRQKVGGDVLHFKMMLFHGQNIVEFSKANFDPFAFVPAAPDNYVDEAVFFTNDTSLTNSFRRRFDDRWIDTADFTDYANITGPLIRTYALYSIDPAMEFVPMENYSDRAVSRYDLENQSIDALVFRVTDHRQADAVIRAVARGVPVRIITDPAEYRNPVRVWDSKHVDRMFVGGAQIKVRRHQGVMHEASVVLHGLGEVIFGSSNWTTASAFYQDEHNYFYNPGLGKPWFFRWFADQFTTKWNDTARYVPFVPLPPDPPSYSAPGNGAAAMPATVTLTWDGGPWSHLYDVHFGTTPNPSLLVGNVELGSPLVGTLETYVVSNLQPGTTYYWQIVDRTWAQRSAAGPVWNFTTAGTSSGTAAYGGAAAPVPGVIEAENFDEGGQSAAYFDTTTGNAGRVYRSTDVDIEPTIDVSGGYNVMKTRRGEWLTYTVNVAPAGIYTLSIRVANVGTGGSFHVEVDRVDKTGAIVVPDTGGWQAWRTITRAGIPLAAGTHVIRIAFDGAATSGGVGNYNWLRLDAEASPPPDANTAFGGTAVSLPGIFQAENFDEGGKSIGYFDTSVGNAGGVYRSTDVDVEPTTDTGVGYNVMKTRAGEWLKYSVRVETAGAYPLEIRLANIGAGGRFHVEVDGVDKTGAIAVPDTGGWQAWQTISAAGIHLAAGPHVIRVVFDVAGTSGGVGNYNWFRFGTS